MENNCKTEARARCIKSCEILQRLACCCCCFGVPGKHIEVACREPDSKQIAAILFVLLTYEKTNSCKASKYSKCKNKTVPFPRANRTPTVLSKLINRFERKKKSLKLPRCYNKLKIAFYYSFMLYWCF